MPWESHVDATTGAAYSWNSETGESRWIVREEATAGAVEEEPPASAAIYANTNATATATAAAAQFAPGGGGGRSAKDRPSGAIDHEVALLAANEVVAVKRQCTQLRAANKKMSRDLRAFQLLKLKREAFGRFKAFAGMLGGGGGGGGGGRAGGSGDGGGTGRAGGDDDDDAEAQPDETNFAAGAVFGAVVGLLVAIAMGPSPFGGGGGGGGGGASAGNGARPSALRSLQRGGAASSSHAVLVELVAYTTHIHLPFLMYVLTHSAAHTMLAVYVCETLEWLNNVLGLVGTHTYDDPLEDVLLGLLGCAWGAAFVRAWGVPRTFPFPTLAENLRFVGFANLYCWGCSFLVAFSWGTLPRRAGLSLYTGWASGLALAIGSFKGCPEPVRQILPMLSVTTWCFGTVFAVAIRDDSTRTVLLVAVLLLSIAFAFAEPAQGSAPQARIAALHLRHGPRLEAFAPTLAAIAFADGILFWFRRSNSVCNTWLALAVSANLIRASLIPASRQAGPKLRLRRR